MTQSLQRFGALAISRACSPSLARRRSGSGRPRACASRSILLATQPVTKHERVRALVAGINAMSTEETYYWYSKCIGVDANRARKALRTLLADD